MNGGSLQVALSVKMSGSIPSPGNTPTNAFPDITVTRAGGATHTVSFGSGTSAADAFCASEFVIAPSGSMTFDLYTGTDLLDTHGFPAPFRVLRDLIVIIARGTGDESGVRCGGAGSNEFKGWFVATGDKQDIFPDGPPFVQGSPEGKSVTTSAKNFKVENLSTEEFVRIRVYAAGGKIVSGMSMGVLGGVYP